MKRKTWKKLNVISEKMNLTPPRIFNCKNVRTGKKYSIVRIYEKKKKHMSIEQNNDR